MVRIAHLSDPHFGTEVLPVQRALEAILRELHPEIVVVSGDITQRARSSQFESARKFVEALPGKRLVIPGNHDIPLFNLAKRLFVPYGNYERYFPVRAPKLREGNLALIGIDASSPFRHTRGVLSLNKTEKILAESREGLQEDSLLGLVIHQPLLVSRKEDLKNLLVRSERLIDLFSKYRVDFVLSGHIHLPYCTSTAEAHEGLEWNFLFVGAGTVVSSRIRPPAPNSFYLVDASSETKKVVKATRYDYIPEEGSFKPSGSKQLSRSPVKGWSLEA